MMFGQDARYEPYSVAACEQDVSLRGYDCENCEHYHVDCTWGDTVQFFLKKGMLDKLPRSLQMKYLTEVFPKDLTEVQASLDAFDKRIHPVKPNLKGI